MKTIKLTRTELVIILRTVTLTVPDDYVVVPEDFNPDSDDFAYWLDRDDPEVIEVRETGEWEDVS